jgi:pimeloyl-ACP methyl ester carboxylesterase
MSSIEVPVATASWGTLVFDVEVQGPDDGEPVVLLHGFPQTNRSWRFQIDALSSAGYRVIAPNQRGYSPGARPTPVEAYGYRELTSDIRAIADALGVGTFHLAGHDWGGAVAWQIAGRHPEWLRTVTSVSTPHPQAFGQSLGGEQAQRSSYVAMFQAEGAEHGMLANEMVGLRLIYLGAGLSEEEAVPYLEALGTPEALGAALNWYRAASLVDIQDLGPITMPTTYIWSTNDPALGRDAAEATAGCVDGPYRFVELEGVDHWVPEHAPDAVTAALLERFASA